MSYDLSPLHRSLRRLQAAFWRRRVLYWLVRAVWLTLLVPLLIIVGYYWQGWQIRPRDLILGMLVVGLLTIVWSIRPIRLEQIAQRLDQRLALQTRLTTALQVAEPTAVTENPVAQRLLQETVQIVTQLRPHINLLNRTFWLEMRTLIGVMALLTGLIVLDTIKPRLPHAALAELPPTWQEPTAKEILDPDIELSPPPFQPEVQPVQNIPAEQIQAALEALADALRDQAATRSVADALDQGDVAGAAAALRRLADQLDQLSDEAQQEIGQALQEAADNIGEAAPSLSQPLAVGSEALGLGATLDASEALEALAEALDALAETPQEIAAGEAAGESTEGQAEQPAETGADPSAQEEAATEGEPTEDQAGAGAGAGDGEGGSDQSTAEERLAAEGQPLELESDSEIEDRVLQPAELDAEAGDRVTQDAPFARQSANAAGDLGSDPLTYPWEKREIVRSYFTP